MEWLVYAFLFMYATWGFYVMVMNLIRVKQNMPLFSKLLAYPVAFVGIIMDVLLNVIIGTILFVELPKVRHLLFTARLQEHIDDFRLSTEPATGLRKWRHNVAIWICVNLLDPFDSKGFHCRDPKEYKK